MAVAERDLTARRSVLPWSGVVAPWLLSRVVSVVVLLAAVNDPARGSRFEQVATRWDGAFYLSAGLLITAVLVSRAIRKPVWTDRAV